MLKRKELNMLVASMSAKHQHYKYPFCKLAVPKLVIVVKNKLSITSMQVNVYCHNTLAK